MKDICTHLDEIQEVTPSARGCEDCFLAASAPLFDVRARRLLRLFAEQACDGFFRRGLLNSALERIEDAQSFNQQADWTTGSRVAGQVRGYFASYDEITRSSLSVPTPAFSDGRLPDGNLFERYGKVDSSINLLSGSLQGCRATAVI